MRSLLLIEMDFFGEGIKNHDETVLTLLHQDPFLKGKR